MHAHSQLFALHLGRAQFYNEKGCSLLSSTVHIYYLSTYFILLSLPFIQLLIQRIVVLEEKYIYIFKF